MKRLLLVGGGHSHVEVLRQLGLAPLAGVEVVLVSPDRYTPYSGMLPGWIAGHYSFADCHIDLVRVARFARTAFRPSRVAVLDPGRNTATLHDGTSIAYDIVSIDIGSTPPLDAIPGALEHATPVKPVGNFIDHIESLAKEIRGGRIARVTVVGAGAAGVEVLLAVRHRLLREAPGVNLVFALVAASPTILPSHAPRVRRKLQHILVERRVTVHMGFDVESIEPGLVRAKDGRAVGGDFVVVATGAAPAAWPIESGLAADPRGFIEVNEHLQSASHPRVFAAGDIASITDHSYPKSGVYAVRQGPVLAANLRRALQGEPLERYVPQPAALALISTGDCYAVASRGVLALEGRWVWRWKDRIDRRFMRKYNELPVD